jgi:hypothetical protein
MSKMVAWKRLSEDEEDYVWGEFYKKFKFLPSVKASKWPGIAEPRSSITYKFSPTIEEEGLKELNRRALKAFKTCFPRGERMFALNWQHLCYSLDPHKRFHRWPFTIYPDGEYYIFLARDFSLGIFGHPWERTLCVFGERLIKVFNIEDLDIISGILRIDGKNSRFRRWKAEFRKRLGS